ncbi:MAG: ORF6N domain-containing protein [Bacteroidales bacterium]|jgi:hypothetical protein|nr:ORF6N domain-containing protein [Bacteroidales bacterium]
MERQVIQHIIQEIRGQKVLLDRDLAAMYGVETKVLNQAVKRNSERFEGEDFMFQLTKQEAELSLRSQIATSNDMFSIENQEHDSLRSQIVTLKNRRGQHLKYRPYAFTELGVAMLSSVLNSKIAIEVNRNIMRTFVLLRQFSLNYKELADKLHEMEQQYDRQFGTINEAIQYLLQKDKIEVEQNNRTRIGFVR